jgi:hypothetical protein
VERSRERKRQRISLLSPLIFAVIPLLFGDALLKKTGAISTVCMKGHVGTEENSESAAIVAPCAGLSRRFADGFHRFDRLISTA